MKRPKLKLVKGHSAVSQPQEPDKLREAIDRFLVNKAGLEDATQKFYQKTLIGYSRISPEWPPTVETVARFVAHCKANYSASTTHQYYGTVKQFVGFLIRRKLIEDNPFEDFSPPPTPEELPRAPASNDLKRFFGYLESEVERVIAPDRKYKYEFYGWRHIRDLAFFSLLLDTGIRIKEACGILVQDVNLEQRAIFIRAAKRKKQRYVVFGTTTRSDLRLWFNLRKTIELSDGSPAYFFLRRYRGWGQITVTGMEQVVTQYSTDLAIEPRLTPHVFRHAHADNAFRAGADPRQVQEQLGHSKLATTLRYAKGVNKRRLIHHDETSPRDLLARGDL